MNKLVSILYKEFGPFVQLFDECSIATRVEDMKDATCILLHGGADIHPSLYKEGQSSMSGAGNEPSARDIFEWRCLQQAIKQGIPIIGICRGAQMLCAAAGGKLFQHVNGHAGRDHIVETYDGHSFYVNSYHHQMQDPRETEHELIAWSGNRSNVYFHVDEVEPPPVDYEMVYYPKINGFAIQWHSEWLDESSEANRYVVNFVKERLLSYVST